MLSRAQAVGLASFIGGVFACALPTFLIVHRDGIDTANRFAQLQIEANKPREVERQITSLTVQENTRVINCFESYDMICNPPAVVMDSLSIVTAHQADRRTPNTIAASVAYLASDVPKIGPRGTVTVVDFIGSLPPGEFNNSARQAELNKRLYDLFSAVCGEIIEVADGMNAIDVEQREYVLPTGWTVLVKHYPKPGEGEFSRAILVQLKRKL